MPIQPWADPIRLLAAYDADQNVSESFAHNLRHLRHVHGGYALAAENRLSFDPRGDYWRRPGRRAAVWYLANLGPGAFAPAAAMRRIGVQVCRALDRITEDEPYEEVRLYHPQWGALVERAIAERLPALASSKDWVAWRAARGAALDRSLADEVAEFLRSTVQSYGAWGAGHEPPLRKRIPWFCYLGAGDDELDRRRAYFFGWANLFCATNAYRFSGSQNFAPVLQNTPSDTLLGYVDQWFAGKDPRDVGFSSFGSHDDAPVDRSKYTPVSELWGLVALNRVPYVNGINSERFRVLALSTGVPEDTLATNYDIAFALGAWVQQLVAAAPEIESRAAALFDGAAGKPLVEPVVPFEMLSTDRLARRLNQPASALEDSRLLQLIEAGARKTFGGWTMRERAIAGIHLLLDAAIDGSRADDELVGPAPELVAPRPPPPPSPLPEGQAAPAPAVPPDAEQARDDIQHLPTPLVPFAQRALAYVRGGMHVLLAGAPGTGKTQIAQFVAAAWNSPRRTLPQTLRVSEAPPTVVANSAWSPFHTIGGLVPDEHQRFVPAPGAFIAKPSSGDTPRTWSLYAGAVVLDEMNRADLDRAIGDLYPMLAGNVRKVNPTGLPGIDEITLPPEFRIIATVNDATIDDVVFPMSQGLARRFVRIDLLGASQADAVDFIRSFRKKDDDGRCAVAESALQALFEAAKEKKLLSGSEERLPFGAGWFALLGRWVQGRFDFPGGGTEVPVDDARRALVASLRSAVRNGDQLASVLAQIDPDNAE